jgi:glycosyltransferase involved in cell wall biosynthesis
MFWRAREDDRDAALLPEPAHWPQVQIIIPARDEAETIGATVRSLVMQDYPGRFDILVVNDRSTDHTARLACAAGAEVLEGRGRAPGWSGKLYALQQGLDAVAGREHALLLFTDADITHAPDSLRRLVQRAADLAVGRQRLGDEVVHLGVVGDVGAHRQCASSHVGDLLGHTVESFDAICKGDFDHVAEQAFFNVGPITDVEEKWAKIQKENG